MTHPQLSNAMDSIPTSVSKFLQTKSFSNGVILLQNEDETNFNSLPEGIGSGDEKHIMQNSARVALILVRSFIDLCNISDICHDQRNHHLSSLELDDFFVNLDKDSSNSTFYGQHNPEGPEGECSDLYEFFQQIISDEEEKNKTQVKDMNGKALGLGYFSFNSGEEDPVMDAQKPKNTGLSSNCLSSDPIDGDKINIVLYGINIVFPTRMNDPEQQQLQKSNTTPMQVLGKLLYGVFCQGEPPPSDIFTRASTPISAETPIDSYSNYYYLERSSKNSRSTQATIFSKLSDSRTLPISICQLLSDMIDTGLDGQSDSPFKSFDEVLEELEQMISKPQLLLHNSDLTQGALSPPIVFGQVYYGREEEVGNIIKIAAQMENISPEANVGVEAVFVSGIAGSGKSQLVQTASGYLSNLGWTLVKAKFERGAEHASRGILSSMFDEVISLLVRLKERGDVSDDTAKGNQASKSILENIGLDGLTQLVDFLPSLQYLFDEIDSESGTYIEDWQLSFFLSKILEAVIGSGLKIMVCCDDVQWADRTSLALITEVLTKLGENLRTACQCCLFLGLYRVDEVDDDHPFSIQYSYLQMSSNINTTEIRLGGLTKKNVADMITSELRLPFRMVRELADIVYKKTSGHAFFIVELLNSLLRDSTISYSPKRCRYYWDQDAVDLIQTGESVAELISSKISSLPEKSQRVLRILSCFGIQTDFPLLQILEDFEEGITSHIDAFIDQGILERASTIIIFSHDLIQQGVYESMELAQRQKLHLEMGTFFGKLAHKNESIDPVTLGMNQLQLKDQTFYAGVSLTASLISIACDQLDSVGPDAISDDLERLEVAKWNLHAGKKSSLQSDFRAAYYYYSQGIEFLGTDCWLNDYRLCLALHEGAVFASFALGESEHAIRFAKKVIKHVSFEDTLEVQFILLKSLCNSGKHDECISRGIRILRKLDFDIPLAPSKEIVMNAMASTEQVFSQYSRDQIMSLCEKAIEDSAQNIIRIMDAFYVSCYATGSPFLSLISCELVKYSLKHGVCQESTVAFASYGMFKIAFGGAAQLVRAKELADIVRAITKKNQNKSSRHKFDIRAHLLLYITIDIWFSSARELSTKLLIYHETATKKNEVDTSMIALQMGWRYLLYGGEKLSIITQSLGDRVEILAKSSEYATKYVALDNALLAELTGQSFDHFAELYGMVSSIDDIEAEARAVSNNRLLHHIHVNKVLLAFWRRDFFAAEKFSHAAWKYPTAMMPQILLIFHTFFGGIIAFKLFRQVDDKEDQRLKEGKEMMERMGRWAQSSLSVFGNKWLLLQAENAASTSKHEEAEEMYKSSITAARDHGNIHELALALEFLGDYYLEHGRRTDANDSYNRAYVSYTQWGATAVAEKLLVKHNLDLDKSDTHPQNGISKRLRDS